MALICASALALMACSDDPSAAERRAALAEDLSGDLVVATDGALDDDQARCVADALIDSVGADSFDRVVAAATAADDAGTDDELRLTVIDAFAGCDALEPLLDRPDG